MTKNNGLTKFPILLGLLFLFVIPELNNVHYEPQPQFWPEIITVWAILCLFIITCYRCPKLSVPWLIIPLALFGIYLTIQPYFTVIDFPGLNYVAALEMATCILLAITIATLKTTFGLATLITMLCQIFLLGSILQTIIGFIQYTGSYSYFGNLIFYDSAAPTANIFGHFGQRNHYAHYLCWGIFAAIYLYHCSKLTAVTFYPLLFWLFFSITISGSRSVFIYFALAVIIVTCYRLNQYHNKNNDQHNRLFSLIILAAVIMAATEYYYPLLNDIFSVNTSTSTGWERISTSSGLGRRSIEWAKAWLVFTNYPLTGIGWNGYARQSIGLYPVFPLPNSTDGLFTNCHNLILQLLAETGIIGTLIVVLGIAIAVYRLIKNSLSPETVIILCMLAVTLAHSMVEYPLWYMYFLVGLITFLALDRPLWVISAKTARYSILLPLCYLIYMLINNSIIFNNLVRDYDAPEDAKTFINNAHHLQNLVDNNVLWSYFALYTLDNYITPDTPLTNKLFPLATQFAYTHRLDSFHPYPDSLIKEAMLEFKRGHKERAKELVSMAVLAYPIYKTTYQNTLKARQYNSLQKLVH